MHTASRLHSSTAGRLVRAGGTVALLLMLALTASPARVAAQPPVPAADASALSLEQLLNVEVESVFGASKSLQKITEAPASVTIVTAEEIERFGWRTLADVLKNVRGFYVTTDRSYAYVGARGFQPPGDYSTRVLLTLDGFRLNDNIFDEALLEEDFPVDLDNLARIEVIRGPSSSLYGSSAFFAIVNLTTKAANAGRHLEVTTSASTGRRGEMRIRGHHDFSDGSALSLMGAFVNASGERLVYSPDYDTPETNDGFAEGLDYMRRRNLFARFDRGAFTMTGVYNTRERGMPTAAYGSVFNRDASNRDEHNVVTASWQRALGRTWTGVFRAGYDRYQFRGSYAYDWDTARGLEEVSYIDRADGQFWSGDAQFSRAFGEAHQFTGGIEHRNNLRKNQYSYIREPYQPLWENRRQSTTTGLYVQDQWRVLPHVLLNGGLRLDHYNEFDDPVKPRVALIIQPTERTTLKAVYGGAFRAPSSFESYYETPGSWRPRPGLKPEQIGTVEGIVEHYAGKRLRLSAGVFRYSVTRLITMVADPDAEGLLSFDNLGAAKAIGVEAEAEAKWPGGLHAKASYTFADGRNAETDAPLVNSPRHVTQGLLSVPLSGRFFASVDVQALSARLSLAGATVPGYVRPNLSVVGRFGMHARTTFTVGNPFDHRYADPVGEDFVQDTIAREGRTARFQLSWAF